MTIYKYDKKLLQIRKASKLQIIVTNVAKNYYHNMTKFKGGQNKRKRV